MGDRANIKIVEEGGEVIYFYTHWGGSELPETLQDALKRGKGRWSDSPYLNRIIFCEMIKNYVLDSEGYGISTSVGDGDHRVIIVNHKQRKITYRMREWTFKEYVEETNLPEL